VAIGLEDLPDIIADFDQALKQVDYRRVRNTLSQ
jgi:hypothetical protein